MRKGEGGGEMRKGGGRGDVHIENATHDCNLKSTISLHVAILPTLKPTWHEHAHIPYTATACKACKKGEKWRVSL